MQQFGDKYVVSIDKKFDQNYINHNQIYTIQFHLIRFAFFAVSPLNINKISTGNNISFNYIRVDKEQPIVLQRSIHVIMRSFV